MPGAIREDALLITVTCDGNVLYGTHQVQSGELPPAIQDAIRRGSERKVYLKVDARAEYGDAVVVIDQVHQGGIENIGIITEQRMPSAAD